MGTSITGHASSARRTRTAVLESTATEALAKVVTPTARRAAPAAAALANHAMMGGTQILTFMVSANSVTPPARRVLVSITRYLAWAARARDVLIPASL